MGEPYRNASSPRVLSSPGWQGLRNARADAFRGPDYQQEAACSVEQNEIPEENQSSLGGLLSADQLFTIHVPVDQK